MRSMTPATCRAVLFDLYGTLVDIFSRREYGRVLGRMSEALDLPPEQFERAWLGGATCARGP